MIQTLFFGVTQTLEGLQIFFNLSIKILDRVIQKLGPNGYLLYGVLSNTLFFLGSLFLKWYPHIDWSISVVARGLTNVICGYIISCSHKKDLTFKGDELKYSSIRNMIIGCQQAFFFYAIVTIPIKIAWILNNVGPIFVFIFGYFIKQSPLTRRDCMYLIVSLIGINIITVPQLFTSIASLFLPIEKEDLIGEMDAYQMLVAFITFISTVTWGFAIIYITFCKTISAAAVNFSFGLHLSLIGSLIIIARSDLIVMPSYSDLLLIVIGVGLPNFLSSILFIHGQMVATNTGIFTLMNYLPVFYSYGFQIIFEDKVPKIIEIIGIFLAIFGLFKVVIKPTVADKAKQLINSTQVNIQTETLGE